MRPWIRFSAVVSILALAACTQPEPAYQPTPPVVAAAPAWAVAADRIDVIEAPGVAAPEPAVAVRLAEAPTETARRLLQARLKADPAARGRVVATIERAEASERYLPRPGGVTAVFTNDPEAEFTVAFAVAVNAYDAQNQPAGAVRAEARASGQLSEKADEDDRRKLWERLVKQAAETLDAELRRQIPAGLGGFARER